MSFEEIKQLLSERFGQEMFVVVNQKVNQPILQLPVQSLAEVCHFLFEDDRLYFDYLTCITGIDNGPEKGTAEVIYHFMSIPYEHSVVLKVEVPRGQQNALTSVPTVSHIWKTADWHEREVYDLVGVDFEGHPDLRRILLPNDWQGFPLRKDYQEQELYHGIKVTY